METTSTNPHSGLTEDQKIALGTGIGVPLGLAVLGLFLKLLWAVIRKKPDVTGGEAIAMELSRWRGLLTHLLRTPHAYGPPTDTELWPESQLPVRRANLSGPERSGFD
jgi:hypothetical protein